jgi:hypothetical protein
MNEQIGQLALQAFRESAWYGGKRGDKDFDQRYNEKFAQLIVKECAQFVEDKFDFVGDEIIVKEKMLEHFEVDL